VGVLRSSTIIYSDLQLLGHLLGLAVVSYIDLLEAARAGTPYPPLYSTGVKYTREPGGAEIWQTWRFVYSTKKADCEDLACARTAELWADGETAARPEVRRITERLRHIVVRRADGTMEDPSLILGMHERRNPLGWQLEAKQALAKVQPAMQTPGEALPWHLPPMAWVLANAAEARASEHA
jgi:hypothetical protein